MSQSEMLEIRGVLLPLKGAQLLLPNATVNEVIGYQDPVPYQNDCEEWLLGTIDWRKRKVPVVAYETLLGLPLPESTNRARIAVCNTLNGSSTCPYVGIRLSAIPHLARVDQETLTAVDGEEPQVMLLRQVAVSGETAWIPDLDGIEKAVLDHLD